MPSPQPAIRPGHSADLAAVTALLKGAGLPTFPRAFRAMQTRIELFLSLPLASLDKLRLKERMDAIGRTPNSDSDAE